MSLLITLVFSSKHVLFDEQLFGLTSFNSFLYEINLYYLLGFSNVGWGMLLSIIILILTIIGYYPRYTCILHWYVTFSFFHSASITDGGDQIATTLSFLIIPIGLLDSRKNQWQDALDTTTFKKFVGNSMLLLISLQMAIIYFHAAIEKVYKVKEWKNGTALFYYLKDELFGYSSNFNFLLDPILLNGYGVSILTWGVIFSEILFFGGIFMSKDSRVRLFVAAVLFHLLIAIFLGLVSFLFAMTGGLVLYLLRSEENLNVLKRLVTWSRV